MSLSAAFFWVFFNWAFLTTDGAFFLLNDFNTDASFLPFPDPFADAFLLATGMISLTASLLLMVFTLSFSIFLAYDLSFSLFWALSSVFWILYLADSTSSWYDALLLFHWCCFLGWGLSARRVSLMQGWASLHQHHQGCPGLNLMSSGLDPQSCLCLDPPASPYHPHHHGMTQQWGPLLLWSFLIGWNLAGWVLHLSTMIACDPTNLMVSFLILLWIEMPTLDQQLEPWCLLVALEDGPRCHSW